MEIGNTPKSTSDWLYLVLGLVGIAVIGYTIFKIIALFLSFLADVDSTVGAAIIASMATIMVGIGGALATQFQISRRQIKEAHREKKIQIYEDFMNMAASHLAQENENIKQRKVPQKELIKFFLKFKTGLILRGSPGVIRAMGEFESASEKDGDVLGAIDQIYREMRKDVGLSNRSLRTKELVAVYLKSEDRDELFR